MCIAYYTVIRVPEFKPKACIVQIYVDGQIFRTVNFPIGRPDFYAKTVNQANEYGRLAVREVMDARS